MAVQDLLPASAGNKQEWDLGAGADKIVAVQTSDADASYIYSSTLNQRCFYIMDPLNPAESISTHTVYFRFRADAANTTCRPYLWSDTPTATEGINRTQDNNYNTWSEADLAHPDAVGWTPGDFSGNGSSIQYGVQKPQVDNVCRCTYIYWRVTYLPPGGSCFYTELGLWLPPLIGLGVSLLNREIWEVLHAIQAAGAPKTILESISRKRVGKNRVMPVLPTFKEEFDAIRDGLAIRPRFCFLGDNMR